MRTLGLRLYLQHRVDRSTGPDQEAIRFLPVHQYGLLETCAQCTKKRAGNCNCLLSLNYIFKLLLLMIPWILHQVGIGFKLVPVDGEQRGVVSIDKHIAWVIVGKCPVSHVGV